VTEWDCSFIVFLRFGSFNYRELFAQIFTLLEAGSLFFVSNDVVNEGTDIRAPLGEFVSRLEFDDT
jgi:hypothetical protein